MVAYVEIRISTDNPGNLKDYQKIAPAIIEKYKGKFIARGGQVITLEGSNESRRVVIIEFPSLEDAKTFYNSREYAQAIELRKGVATADIIAIEGVAE